MGSGAPGTGPGAKLKKWEILLYRLVFCDYIIEPMRVEIANIPVGDWKIIPNCIGHREGNTLLWPLECAS